MALWAAIFSAASITTINGFSKEYYLAYVLWGAFIARISTSWMYEHRMIDEIDTGSVNSVLARPISFYEYYLAQFMGYKALTSAFSLIVPILITSFIPGPTQLSRFPLAIALVFFYLLLVHTISFCIASCGFFFNRVHSFTVAKNFALWLATGELFPLDLIPEPFRQTLIALPFSAGVYLPVGYITGRVGLSEVAQGFVSVAAGLVVFGFIARLIWTAGRRHYSGTGA